MHKFQSSFENCNLKADVVVNWHESVMKKRTTNSNDDSDKERIHRNDDFLQKKKKILNFPLLIFIDISLSTSFCTVQILSCKTKGPCSVQNLKFVEHLDKSQPCYLLDDDYRDISQSPETSSLVSIRRIFLFKHRYRSEAS